MDDLKKSVANPDAETRALISTVEDKVRELEKSKGFKS